MTSKDFAGLGLPETIVNQLTESGFVTPTPIQAKAIPAQLQGRDILGIAQTGSGKTAAFALPILAGLMELNGRPSPKTARALILVPTRELAVQIDDMIKLYSPGRRFTTALILGGMSRHAQIQKLGRGVDVAIATPGRLHDLLDDGKFRLNETRWLVLDEADRMLDMGFIKQVRDIAKAIGHRRKTALFSATMAPEISKLAESLLNEPVRVEAAAQGSTVAKIDQSVILSGAKQKRSKLNELLADDDLKKVVIFSRTKHGADRVAKNLVADGFDAAAIHGNKTQSARQAALRGFRAGKVRILVATDIVARGIDVPDITHVINFELPDDPENYVHRIGRTGRNGASGTAITLIDGTERGKLRQIERLIRRTLPVSGELPQGEPTQAPKREQRRGGGRPGGGFNSGRRDGNGPRREGKGPRRENNNGPRREGGAGGKNRRPNSNGGSWTVPLDNVDADITPSAPKQNGKPSKGKKPRWNKNQKDTARASQKGEQRGRGNRRGNAA